MRRLIKWLVKCYNDSAVGTVESYNTITERNTDL